MKKKLFYLFALLGIFVTSCSDSTPGIRLESQDLAPFVGEFLGTGRTTVTVTTPAETEGEKDKVEVTKAKFKNILAKVEVIEGKQQFSITLESKESVADFEPFTFTANAGVITASCVFDGKIATSHGWEEILFTGGILNQRMTISGTAVNKEGHKLAFSYVGTIGRELEEDFSEFLGEVTGKATVKVGDTETTQSNIVVTTAVKDVEKVNLLEIKVEVPKEAQFKGKYNFEVHAQVANGVCTFDETAVEVDGLSDAKLSGNIKEGTTTLVLKGQSTKTKKEVEITFVSVQ